MGKAKTPKVAPLGDLNALSEKTYNMNKKMASDTTLANRANQNNPFGSLKWSKDPTSGQWTQDQSFNKGEQGLYDQNLGLRGQANEAAKGMYDRFTGDYSGAPAMPTVGGYNQEVMDTIRKLQAPELQRSRSAKEAQLAAMGLGTGSGMAWDTEQNNIGTNENDADLKAILGGYDQGNKEFAQGMGARQQGVSEINDMYKQMLGLQQSGSPSELQFDDNYAQQQAVAAPDYAQISKDIQAWQQQKNNAKAASSGGGLGGMLGSIGGTLLGSMAGPMGASLGSSLGGGLLGGGGSSLAGNFGKTIMGGSMF
jgi:hypothetical protein